MILSIDESIQRLKAEIIAQDWSLSQKRITLLEASFTCLKHRFKSRKAAFAILTMAGSVLDYIKRRGENTPTVTIDFLKEAMAHIVNLYEDGNFNPEQEEKIFRSLYSRFSALKQQIYADRPGKTSSSAGSVSPESETKKIIGVKKTFSPAAISQLENKITALRRQSVKAGLDKEDIVRLIQDLQSSLDQAEEVGSTIRTLLDDLLSLNESAPAGDNNEESADNFPPPQDLSARQEIKICPTTELRGLTIGEAHVYIRESSIAMIRNLNTKKKKEYLKDSSIPLKDFSRFLTSLSKQFKGQMAKIADKKLKKLNLPIMLPSGIGLPEIIDENGTKLVVVSNGHWNGILICSKIDNKTVNMVKFKKATNGDFAGIGYTDDGKELSLLNIVSLLRREGFLTMV